jgi:tRNA 2-thiouridine synthesizing protein C
MAAREALDIALAGGAFDLPVSMLFMDDGVFQLTPSQAASRLEQKDLSANLQALPLFGVEKLYALENSLLERNLKPSMFELDVESLSNAQVRLLLNEHDMVITL